MKLFFKVFWRNLQSDRRNLWIFIPLAFVLSLFWIVEPLYGRFAIDEMLKMASGESVRIGRLIAGWFGIYVVISILQGFGKYYRWEILRQLLIETRHSYYEKLLQLDISHHIGAKTGELMKKIDNAADAMRNLASQIVIELFPTIFTSLAFLIISFYVSWQLALVTVAMTPVFVLFTFFSVRWTRKHMDKVNTLWVASMGRGYDAVTNIFTVKSSAAEERELDRMRALHEESAVALRKVQLPWALMEGIGYFMLIRIVMICVGIYLLAHGKISLGSLFFFQFSFYRIVIPFEMLGNVMPQWNELTGKIRMAEEIYQTPILVSNSAHPQKLSPLRGAFAFQDVSFSYGTIEAIHHLNLAVEAGEHIAFVGHSGAGKSTLAMLLNRFYDVTSGTILVDDVDLRELDLHWWRQQVGLVLQENITFNDTIEENIRYSRPDATREEIEEAARRASAHAFIQRLPQGYQSLVGERGVKLSGGERQRIAIARAILKQPKIVVLDEATSALDSITEREVQQGIKELIAGRTSFIIAHRLSTVRSVDRIAILENGRLVACAPHEELLTQSPVYKEMVELQQGGLLAE